MEVFNEQDIRTLVECLGYSYANISRWCKLQHPGLKGLSKRSVRRYCINHGITRRSRLDECAVSRFVYSNVLRVNAIKVVYVYIYTTLY